MTKQTLLIIALLTNSAFAQAQNLPNYISVNNSSVPQISTNASQNQMPNNIAELSQGQSLGGGQDMSGIMSSINAMNAKAIAAHDPTAGLSAKDKAEFANSMDKIKKLQESSQKMQEQFASDQAVQPQLNKQQNQQQQKAMAAKKMETPALKDININNISGWNTTTIDDFTKQGKDNLDKRYSEFLGK